MDNIIFSTNGVGRIFFFLFLIAGFFNFFFTARINAKPDDSIKRLIGPNDALVVMDHTGNTLHAINADKMLIPASTLKILTALASFHFLGPNYHFQTEFYVDQKSNLKIKGYGDPLLISETMPDIAGSLATYAKQVNNIVLDDSYFKKPIIVPGAANRSVQPYDAPNGALCVNFNTVYFIRNKNGSYESAEPQTPLLPFVMERVTSSTLEKGRIILFRENDEFVLYAGHLFRHFLQLQGVPVHGAIYVGPVVASTDTLILRHQSIYSLQAIIPKMLLYSNNFTANQLLIAVGAKRFGPPGTLDKGIRASMEYASSELGITGLQMVEGSGLSRYNRMSADMLIKTLKAFEPYRHLMRKEKRDYFKTGTLNNIHTRVGFIEVDGGHFLSYAVLMNTPGKSTRPVMKKLLSMY